MTLPPLPMKTNSTHVGMRDLVIKAKGEHTMNDAFGIEQQQVAFQEHMLDRTVSNAMTGYPLSQTQKKYMSALEKFMTMSLEEKVNWAITFFVFFSLGLLLLIIFSNWQGLQGVFKSCLSACETVLTCCGLCKSNSAVNAVDVEKAVAQETWTPNAVSR